MLGDGKTAPNEPLPQSARQPLLLHSRDLFAQQRQVLIRHGPDTYVLRLTRQGKLILTK
jgi:hemin uptake protein HemP